MLRIFHILIASAASVAAVVAVERVGASGGPEESVKMLVPAAAMTAVAALPGHGVEPVARRGGYDVISVPADRVAELMAAGATLRRDFDTIRLRHGVIDTRAAAPAQPSRRLRLVQFSAPPGDDELAALLAAGLRPVHYVAHNAYLVWADDTAGTHRRKRAAGALQYEADYLPGYALAPALARATGGGGRSGFSAAADEVEVAVQLFHHGDGVKNDIARVVSLASRTTARPVRVLGGRYVNLRVRVARASLEALAAVDAVVSVEPYVEPRPVGERQGRILAGSLDADGIEPLGPGYLSWLAARGFSTSPADYPVVVVVDDGVDNGTTTPASAELYQLGDPALASRIAFSVLPPGSQAAGPEGPDGHGHLNASIAGGYQAGAGPGVEDGFGFNFGLGISPFGRLASVRIFAPSFDAGFGDATMVDDYHARGARISSNSWGADVAGDYTIDAQLYDGLTRDARAAVAGNQEMLFVVAAGNAGPTAGSVGSPGTAKNVLTVGASETSNPAAAAGDGCGQTIIDGDDARDIADFSSRGPTADGRIKPDIVAPGTFVHGAASRPEFNGSGVCGAATNDGQAPGADALFPAATGYTWSSGTSHSTPAVAGYASLASEFLAREHGHAEPSPALLKAFILNSARYLDGDGAGEELPGDAQGFGAADMGVGFEPTAARYLIDQATVFGSSGGSFSVHGQVIDAGRPVRVTLVWTDAPGPTFGDAFVNDLDLVVEAGGTLYRGNNFSGGLSVPGGAADARNNAEAVVLAAGLAGPATIRVDATTIADDGVPGNGDGSDQDFALVAYNFSTVVPAGAVFLDRTSYACADTVAVAVSDSDLAGDGELSVTLTTSAGDAEDLLVSETTVGSGSFSAAIAVSAEVPVAGDGMLQAGEGSAITATYHDADDGSGSPAVVEAAAVVDCAAPVISMVTASDVGGFTATVSFGTDEAAAGQVGYGTSCDDLLTHETEIGASTAHVLELSALEPATRHFYAVDAVDVAGNVAGDDNGGACYSFTTLDATDHFTEQFSGAGNDLDNQSLTLTPDGSSDFYTACRVPVTSFRTDPVGGTVLALGDDEAVAVPLAGGARVWLYGVSYGVLHVGSNGYLTFAAPDVDFSESLEDHFAVPRISALFDDLDPGRGGQVSWQQLADRVAVTWTGVAEFFEGGANSFQVELFFDGTVRITHLGITAGDGIVGISEGLGLPADHQPGDLGAYGLCLTECGDGLVGLGEGCDDGNDVDGDCCSSSCEPAAPGSPCDDDGDVCNGAESCDGAGMCSSGPALVCSDGDACNGIEVCMAGQGCRAGTPPACDDGDDCNGVESCDDVLGCVAGAPLECSDGDVCTFDTCDAVSGCSSSEAPDPACLQAGRGVLLLRVAADPSADVLKWKWLQGAGLLHAQLGDPAATTDMSVCIYDSAGGQSLLAGRLQVPAGPAWDERAPRGWSYGDRDGKADGVSRLQIKASGVGKSKVQLTARGASIPMPTPVTSSRYFDQVPDLTVQLVGDDVSTCFTSTFHRSIRNTGEQFKARTP